MQLQSFWFDRGETPNKARQGETPGNFRVGAVSRSASLGAAETEGSFWLMVRGEAQFECREGRFRLQAGDWVTLDRESRPSLLAGPRSLALVLLLPSSGTSALEHPELPVLLPGRGRIAVRERRLALRLWRSMGAFSERPQEHPSDSAARLRYLLHFLSSLQVDLAAFISRCPGRSLRRKRQIFGKMQRAVLHLEGNLSTPLRMRDLAQLCSCTVWHFTKTFHVLYQLRPQEMVARSRLRHAASLLRHTDLSVNEISASCGYENACSFARAFRRVHGTTASQFRANGRYTPMPKSERNNHKHGMPTLNYRL